MGVERSRIFLDGLRKTFLKKSEMFPLEPNCCAQQKITTKMIKRRLYFIIPLRT
jgi:hypothetical protein